jgi:hypothetical protein
MRWPGRSGSCSPGKGSLIPWLAQCRQHKGMSTKDQILSSPYGEALLTAKRPELQPLIDHLREVAQGRDDIRVECAGTMAGSWFAGAARQSHELIAAGLLMFAGPR